jgi:hypothetical protein
VEDEGEVQFLAEKESGWPSFGKVRMDQSRFHTLQLRVIFGASPGPAVKLTADPGRWGTIWSQQNGHLPQFKVFVRRG